MDVAGGKVYWTYQSARIIQRSNLDGTNVQDVVTGLGVGTGSGIVNLYIDVVEGKLYWTDNGGRKVQRTDMDGLGLVETIVIQASG